MISSSTTGFYVGDLSNVLRIGDRHSMVYAGTPPFTRRVAGRHRAPHHRGESDATAGAGFIGIRERRTRRTKQRYHRRQ
jgi:hypothetical protein